VTIAERQRLALSCTLGPGPRRTTPDRDAGRSAAPRAPPLRDAHAFTSLSLKLTPGRRAGAQPESGPSEASRRLPLGRRNPYHRVAIWPRYATAGRTGVTPLETDGRFSLWVLVFQFHLVTPNGGRFPNAVKPPGDKAIDREKYARCHGPQPHIMRLLRESEQVKN